MTPSIEPSYDPEPQQMQDLPELIYSPAEERFDRITNLARRIFDTPISLVSLVTDRSEWFKSAQGIYIPETPKEASLCRYTLRQGDTLVVPDTLLDLELASHPLVTAAPYIRFYAGQPLFYDGEKIGSLCIMDYQPRQFSSTDIETLKSLARWVENELKVSALSEAQKQLLQEKDEAERRTLVDPLTKLWNRTGMDYLLARELSSAQRKKLQVVVMLLDIDHHQQLYQRYGDPVGDYALREVAARIRASVRPHDVLIRYGDDQYLLFAADCAQSTGMTLAERILARVSTQHITDGKHYFSVKLSIGLVSTTAQQGLSIAKLIQGAERALKDAKGAGRDCAKALAL